MRDALLFFWALNFGCVGCVLCGLNPNKVSFAEDLLIYRTALYSAVDVIIVSRGGVVSSRPAAKDNLRYLLLVHWLVLVQLLHFHHEIAK